jgi:hypothetical protein
MTSRLYNTLPERIRILENFRSFKNEVKTLLITKTYAMFSSDEGLSITHHVWGHSVA